MTFIRQLPGIVALVATLLLTSVDPEGVSMALGPLAIAGIGLGTKVLGGVVGGLRRRKRRKRQQRAIAQATEAQLQGLTEAEDAIKGISRGAIQAGLAARSLQSADQERQLESLSQEALAASGGAQAGLDPAQLEAVIRANAMSNLQIDAGIADTITRAAQREAGARAALRQQRGAVRAGGIMASAEARNQSAKEADAALGGIFESAGSLIGGLFPAGGAAGAATGGGLTSRPFTSFGLGL